MAGTRKPRQRQDAYLRVAGFLVAKVSLLALRWRPVPGQKRPYSASSRSGHSKRRSRLVIGGIE